MKFIKTNKLRRRAIIYTLVFIFVAVAVTTNSLPILTSILVLAVFGFPMLSLSSFCYVNVKFEGDNIVCIVKVMETEKLSVFDIEKISFSKPKYWQKIHDGFGPGAHTVIINYPIMLIQSSSLARSIKVYKSFVDIKDSRLDDFLFRIMALNPSIICDDLQEFRNRVSEM